MPYAVYKILHVVGALMLFAGLGGALVHAANRGERAANALRGTVAALHGVGLLLMLVAGFGLLARLDVGFPGWVLAKMSIWLVLGGLVAVPYRKPEWSGVLLWLIPLLGGLAAYLAVYKPF